MRLNNTLRKLKKISYNHFSFNLENDLPLYQCLLTKKGKKEWLLQR